MGGAVAALAALLEPRRVASLTLLAPGGFGPEINHRLLMRYAVAHDPEVMRLCLEAMYGWNADVDEETVVRMAAERAVPRRREMLAGIGAAMVRDGRQGQIPREALAGLTMPVRILWGTIDNVLPAHQTRDLPPNFELRLLDGVGHMLPQEAPAEIIACVEASVLRCR